MAVLVYHYNKSPKCLKNLLQEKLIEKVSQCCFRKKMFPALILVLCICGFISCNNQNKTKDESLILVAEQQSANCQSSKVEHTIRIYSELGCPCKCLPGHFKAEVPYSLMTARQSETAGKSWFLHRVRGNNQQRG